MQVQPKQVESDRAELLIGDLDAVISDLKTLEARADKYIEKPVSAFVNHSIRSGITALTSTFDAESVVQLKPLRFSVQDTIDRLCEVSPERCLTLVTK